MVDSNPAEVESGFKPTPPLRLLASNGDVSAREPLANKPDGSEDVPSNDAATVWQANGPTASNAGPEPNASQENAADDANGTGASPGILKRGGRGVGRGSRGGRASKRASFAVDDHDAAVAMGGETGETQTSSVRGRGRGGRPRGRARGSGRGGKRKRGDDDDGDGDRDDSDSSEVYTPTAIITKSGRSIQKPTTFVPPPAPAASPTTVVKRKRTWRRNPENAVCKSCLRGVSPASNMIVFCDGCNTAYHRYCHHPPIDQSVVDEVDKEWYCRQCQRQRIEPVPEAAVADFVAARGASLEERQKFFSRLAPGVLVTLLTRATTLQPDLPVFSPDFRSETSQIGGSDATGQPPSENTTAKLPAAASTGPRNDTRHPIITLANEEDDEDVFDDHPAHYPRPGHGLMRTLPPEREDQLWLVDEENSRGVFQHVYQVDAQAANAGVSEAVA